MTLRSSYDMTVKRLIWAPNPPQQGSALNRVDARAGAMMNAAHMTVNENLTARRGDNGFPPDCDWKGLATPVPRD